MYQIVNKKNYYHSAKYKILIFTTFLILFSNIRATKKCHICFNVNEHCLIVLYSLKSLESMKVYCVEASTRLTFSQLLYGHDQLVQLVLLNAVFQLMVIDCIQFSSVQFSIYISEKKVQITWQNIKCDCMCIMHIDLICDSKKKFRSFIGAAQS